MNRERRGEPGPIFPGDFGAPFAPRELQRQAGMAGEQLSASAEIQCPPQDVEIKMFTSVPIWQADARILSDTGLAEMGNALVRIAARSLQSNGPRVAFPASN
jgi:hypothetical protein